MNTKFDGYPSDTFSSNEVEHSYAKQGIRPAPGRGSPLHPSDKPSFAQILLGVAMCIILGLMLGYAF